MDQWIYYIALTMTYCAAPEGKTVCERRVDQYIFTDALHCEVVREELTILYNKYTNIILYEDESRCHPIVEQFNPENRVFDNSRDTVTARL